MKKLTLLGIWNQLPLIAWPWFADAGILHFYKLSGYRVRSFTFVKKELHRQYFLSSDLEKIKNYIDSLSKDRQIKFVKKIFSDYYVQAKKAEFFLRNIHKKKFSKLTNNEFAKIIKNWKEIFPLGSLQIWFVLFLDIWYPENSAKKEMKRIGSLARSHSGYLHDRADIILQRVFSEIEKRIFLDKKDIYYLFPDEILLCLFGKIPSKSIIGKRKKLCVTTSIFGKYSIYESKKASRLVNAYIQYSKRKKLKNKSLQGLAANSGKILGRVHIILKDEEFKEFKKGEILVACQTMIDYVPIMKKAKAILTEYGGITSHAAIISRELKKPCIVGIKNLTSLLQNGDLVEVDADKGTVRIIK